MASGQTPRGAAPGLAIRDVGVAYGGRPILDRLDLDLTGAETTVLLGMSGVGKSTLLRRIAGLLDGPGAILAHDGQPLAGRIAFMAQSDLLLPWLTVAGNVALGHRLRGAHPDPGRIGEMLATVGLADAAAKRPAQLSGGMRQRAALARTLMEDRPVVLMDEPYSAVDALTRLRLQDLGLRLLAGRTVVMVTHEPFEAIRLADRIVVLAGAPARPVLDIRPESGKPRAPDSVEAQTLWRRIVEALGVEQAA
ncbi:ABC transporter ATP-binding protein [Minwuia thermotolerans]|uniref:ABC transporter ATP-binding protein n=1 Tax=Minwuia thermotolerans TaxID=2056226 RepID=A0A2M9G6B6_9PROT|nr:ABC transporter ATP-binding protein [Minwuia thermotolerans]PJK31252.1 ABC transporter ATP-binding protein [Minwuia thermotolerans]